MSLTPAFLRRFCRVFAGSLFLLCRLAAPAAAQLTDLGAKVLNECAAPGDCLQFEGFSSALAAGDFDDDGFTDLAVGVPGEFVGPDQNAGSVHVYYGSPAGLTGEGEQIFDQDHAAIGGASEAGDRFGAALAVGDFDIDGFDDLAIGIDGEALDAGANAGAIVVLFGSSSGLAAGGSLFFSQNTLPPGSSESTEAADSFGAPLAASPEGSLAIGVPGESFFLPNETHAGLVQILRTSAPGSPFDSASERSQNDFLDECGAFDGNELQEFWGRALAFGNFGSTSSSLVVGGFTESFDGVGSAGRITVMFGSTLGCFDQNTPSIADVAEPGDLFGFALATGDFDDDSFDDLAIGVPGETHASGAGGRAGIVQVLQGSSSGLTTIDDLFSQLDFPLGQGPGDLDDEFGWALASGDFDGDGIDDLAIGVPAEDVEATSGTSVDAGTVHARYGSASGFVDARDQTFNSNFPAGMPDSANPGDNFGEVLATGDFDGNGTDDLVVGMPGEVENGQTGAGAATVLYGLDRSIGAFGTVRLGSAISVPETTGARPVFVTREGGAVVAASVSHSRSGGSATPGVDFNYNAGVEDWNPGELGVEFFAYSVVPDTLDEGDETIVFSLSNPSSGLALASPSTVTVTIRDDDEGGVVQFQAPVQVFPEDAGSAAVVVTRTAGAASHASVQFATAGASATSGVDFLPTSGTLTFAADETVRIIHVPILEDEVQELSEVFTVTLSNPGGGASLGTFSVVQVVILGEGIFLDGFENGSTTRWSAVVP
jgi:hypothetical protein